MTPSALTLGSSLGTQLPVFIKATRSVMPSVNYTEHVAVLWSCWVCQVYSRVNITH